MDSLGTRVRFYRQVAEINQTALARRINVAPAYVSQIEADQRTPSLKVLERLADALGVDVWLLMKPSKHHHYLSRGEKLELLRTLLMSISKEAA